MYINGTLYADLNTLTNMSKDIGGGLYAKREDNCVEVTFPSGTGVEFCEAKGMLTFVVTTSSDYFNKTKGLLGTYNGNAADDFTLPNGTVLSPSMTPKQIHYDFGLKCKFFFVYLLIYTPLPSPMTRGPGDVSHINVAGRGAG